MKHHLKKYGEWALVTGGSSGIGYEIARQLISDGMKCILISRTEVKLFAAVEELGTENCQHIAADLCAPDEVEKILEKVSSLDIGLCVHSAGSVFMGRFLDQSVENSNRLLGLHIQTTNKLTQLLGRRFRERGGGGFILVASGLGYVPIPHCTVYAASKAYMLSFGHALHHELKSDHIDVVTLAPGGTKTNMATELGQYLDLTKLPFPMGSVDPVARAAIKGLKSGGIVVPGIMNKFLVFMMRFIPGRNVMAKIFGSQMRKALLPTSTETDKG